MARADRRESPVFLHCPSAFPDQPLDERRHRRREGFVDPVFGEAAVIAVGAGNGQGDQCRPTLDFRDALSSGDIPGLVSVGRRRPIAREKASLTND